MPRKKGEKIAEKPRCTETQKRKRVEEFLRLKLDGAEMWDLREYVREQEKIADSIWFLEPGDKSLSETSLWRYSKLASDAISESCITDRQELVKTHLSKRRNLYAKAVLSGDYRTALACARDEAELIGMYPPKSLEVTGKDGAPIPMMIEIVNVSEHPLPSGPASDAAQANEAGS